MYILALIILFEVFGKELKVNENSTKVFSEESIREEEIQLRLTEEKDLIQLHTTSTNLDISALHLDKQSYPLCRPQLQAIVFDEFQNHKEVIFKGENQKVPQLNRDDPSYFLSSPILGNLVHVSNGFVGVSTDHRLVIFNVTQSEGSKTGFLTTKTEVIPFGFLRPAASETEIPQIVYEPVSKHIYIIYNQQIITGFIDLQLLERLTPVLDNLFEKSNNRRGAIKLKELCRNHQNCSLAFICSFRLINHQEKIIGSDGLDIYTIKQNGDLDFVENLNMSSIYVGALRPLRLFIIDVAIGGKNGEHLYILDYNYGVVPFKLSTGQQLTYQINKDLDIMYSMGCKIIKEYNEQSILLLCERGQNQFVNELGLDLKTSSWFKLKTHFLMGKYFDLDVTERFALLRGVDAHRVIFHSIWQGFQPIFDNSLEDDRGKETSNMKDEQYLYIPHLQSVEFFSTGFGSGDPSTWHYGLNYSFIFGMTTHSIVEVPWLYRSPKITCIFNSKELVGQKFTYQIQVSQSSCPLKEDFLENRTVSDSTPPQLMMCSQKQNLTFSLINAVTYKYDTILMKHWVKFLTVLLLIITAILFYLFRRFRKQKVVLENEIQGFSEDPRGIDSSKSEL